MKGRSLEIPTGGCTLSNTIKTKGAGSLRERSGYPNRDQSKIQNALRERIRVEIRFEKVEILHPKDSNWGNFLSNAE